jgi:hypothetical protein
MSKVKEAKIKQGYRDKPVQRICSNCQHFKSERVMVSGPSTFYPEGYWRNKNFRCGIGGFAVKNMASCNEFKERT